MPNQYTNVTPYKNCWRVCTAITYNGEKSLYFLCLARFSIQCIMQQATWLNMMSPNQTDDIWCYLGGWAQIQQRKRVQCKAWIGKQLQFFFVAACGLQKMLPPCPGLRETILG